MYCDNLVCFFTMTGLFIVMAYHIVAYMRLVQYCIEHGGVDGDIEGACSKEVLESRYKLIYIFWWDIFIIFFNLLAVISFCMAQKYQNLWFKIFKEQDKHRQDKVSGFKSRDRYIQFFV